MLLKKLTALYSDLDWQYNNAMSGPYQDLRNKSEDGETVAGLKEGRISGAWRPMVCVGSEKWQKSEIKRLWEISNDIYYLDFLINGQLSEVSKFLLLHGYRARPVYTQIINLTKSQEELHADLRKSYKSLINWGLNDDNCVLSYLPVKYDTKKRWQAFKELHQKIKGKKRNNKTWNIQYEQMAKDEGYALLMYIEKEVVAGGYFIASEYYVYYASAVSTKINSHAILWEAILIAKERKCKSFELGEQVYCPGQIMMDGKRATEKNCNISLFKSGFGGMTQTRLILEKY